MLPYDRRKKNLHVSKSLCETGDGVVLLRANTIPFLAMSKRYNNIMEKKLPNHKYRFIKEAPISELPRNHRRLQVFYFKGTKCVTCGMDCNRLILGQDNGGGTHWDLYNYTLTKMLTVGHIIPASHGGKFELSNLRPLCHKCNTKEGNSFKHILDDPNLFETHCKGKQIKRASGNNFQDNQSTATIESIFSSKGTIYFGLVGGFTYPTKSSIFI